MPELPEVETVVAGLKPQIIGAKLVSVSHSGKSLRYPLPCFSLLLSLRITDVTRRAKYLLFHFEHGQVLIWHLGMTGQFHVLPQSAQAATHEHVTLTFENGQTLRYRDTRRFGYAGLCDVHKLNQHPWFAKLGLEPLLSGFDGKYLKNRLKNRKTSIKQAMMDNHIVVGVGNIYASEALYRAGINPKQAANSLHSKQYEALTQHIKAVLHEAIEAGGSTISDFVKADGKPGYFAHSFQVYGRDKQPCLKCKTSIEKIILGGRASFFCPKCQPLK